MIRWLAFALIALMALPLGCGCGDDEDDDDDAGGGLHDDDDAADDDSDDDDDADDDDTGDDDDVPFEFACDDFGLTARDFIDAEDSAALYAVAADFTVETTAGPWNFADEFTGCETYLFIQDLPRQNAQFPDLLWGRESDAAGLCAALPDNAHVFFVSIDKDQDGRDASLATIMERVDAHLATLDETAAAALSRRIHYLPAYARDLPGWLGELMTDPRWGFGIDRMQRIRYIGSYADPRRFNGSVGWFEPNLAMAANEADLYNFESDRDERLAAQGATVVTLFDEELSDPGWAGTRGYADVTLPDAGTMAAFGAAELDLYLGCVGEGEYGTCPAWDYIVNLYLCEADDPDTCDTEIGRWITTYHREGRWVHDITPLLPLLAGGGERRFAFYTQQPYDVKLELRLLPGAKAERPVATHFLFSGGAFDLDYNDAYAPLAIDVPDTAARVEIATVITGHGGEANTNCAEFCDTTHHFTINGVEYVREFPDASSQFGCMDEVGQGTVPNQYGTWWYGRSGWCPGREVQVSRWDVSADAILGGENVITYEGFYEGEPFPYDGANIVMTSWLTVYE